VQLPDAQLPAQAIIDLLGKEYRQVEVQPGDDGVDFDRLSVEQRLDILWSDFLYKLNSALFGILQHLTRWQFLLFGHGRGSIPLRFQPVQNVVGLALADVPDEAEVGAELLVQTVPMGRL